MTEYECYVCEEYIHMDETGEDWEQSEGLLTHILFLRCPKCGAMYRYEEYYKSIEGESMERIYEGKE